MLPRHNGFVFVAGSAHIDVLARSSEEGFSIEMPGRVFLEIGGPACRIATHLSALNRQVRFLTALNKSSPYSSMILSHLAEHNIDVRVMHDDDLPSAVVTTHIGSGGDVLSAVSSIPVGDHAFEEKEVREAMQGAVCAILDCYLSPPALSMMANAANALGIPLYISTVSSAKSLRVAPLPRSDAVFFDESNAKYFAKSIGSDPSLSAISMALSSTVVCHMHNVGASIALPSGEIFSFPVLAASAQHLSGGDNAFIAAFIHKSLEGADLHEVVDFSAAFVAQQNGARKGLDHALQSLHSQASRDPLTGLFNRRYIDREINRALAILDSRGEPFSLVILDIDHFKSINDRFGHDVGDIVIKTVGEVLQATLRNTDVAARWGGEEYLCLLHNTERDTAAQVAERIRAQIEKTVFEGAGRVTASVGVCAADDASLGHTELIRRADNALYRSKRNGRNMVSVHVFDVDMAP